MEPLDYYKELIAFIGGVMLVLLPLALRFLLFRPKAKRQSERPGDARKTKLKPRSKQKPSLISRGHRQGPVDRDTPIDGGQFIRRIRAGDSRTDVQTS